MRSTLFLAASFVLLVAILFVLVHEPAKDLTSSYLENQQRLEEVIPIGGGAVGPESFAFRGGDAGPYTGVSDGRIIKWQGNESRWVNFAVTSPHRSGCEGSHGHGRKEHICGRPLGLCFNDKTGDLYIADAYMGLLVVGSTGGLATQLVVEAHGVPLGFTNSLDIDQNTGVVYFTDSSTKFQRRNYVSVIVSGDNSGRLLKYDPRSSEVEVLVENLMFPNGVALSKGGEFILIAETTRCRILKFWVKPTSKSSGKVVEVFAELPGFPDNIKRNGKGEFWVAINSRRGKLLKWILSHEWIRNIIGLTTRTQLPFDITNAYSYFADFFGRSLALKLDENGDILEKLVDREGKNKRWKHVSEVYQEENGNLWIGSVEIPFAVKLKVSSELNMSKYDI